MRKIWRVLMVVLDIAIILGLIAAIWWAVYTFGGDVPTPHDIFGVGF